MTTNGYPPSTSSEIFGWWLAMVVIVCCNIVVYAVCFALTREYTRAHHLNRHSWSYYYCLAMRWLPLPYVFECTWRAFLPALYNERQTITDDPASSILLERLLAAVGEICWGLQMALALAAITRSIPLRGSDRVRSLIGTWNPRVAMLVASLAAIAQIFSITGMITTNYVFVVVEETLWAAIFFFGALATLSLWHFGCDDWHINVFHRPFGRNGEMYAFSEEENVNFTEVKTKEHHHDDVSVWIMRIFIRVMALFGIAATPYMVAVDIPKWYSRYAQDEAARKPYLSGNEALEDAANRRVVTQSYAAWSGDMFWMAAYFSAGCLASITLSFAPGRVKIESCDCAGHTHHPLIGGVGGSEGGAVVADARERDV